MTDNVRQPMIRIVGLSASPQRGASEAILEKALVAARAVDDRIETIPLTMRGKKILPCNDCKYCKRNKTWCIIKDDMQPIFNELLRADALLVVSPVYVMSATPQLHAFCSRMRPAMHVFPGVFRNKFVAAAAVGGTRNGGQEITISDVNNLFMTRSMNVVSNETGYYAGAKIWSKDSGAEGALSDEDGISSAEKLGAKLAEVALTYRLGLLARGKDLPDLRRCLARICCRDDQGE